MYRCKICGKKYTELTALYNHIESKHRDMIPKDMNVQQYYYYMKTGKMNGNCVMCKQPTSWNHNTCKYNRFCGSEKCKDEYVKIMKSRMVAKYGKTHLLNDPNKQREMLSHRSISGVYKWSDGKHETTYTGSYELDFLKTLDGFFDWDPTDISMPSPHTYTYKYEGEDRFYIPDVFIHSLDLEIEIKDGGDNPNNHHKIQEVDKEKERLKDEVMCSQKAFHYIKITNKNYENFFRFLKEIKKEFEKHEDETKIPRIFKIEDIKGTNAKPVKESTEIIEEDFHIKANELIVKFDKFTNVKYKERDYFFSLKYDLVKNDPKELQDYLSKLIKAARFEDDIWYVQKMAKKADDYYKKRLRKHPEMKDVYGIYYDWLKDGGIDKEIKTRRKEGVKLINESVETLEEKFEPDKFLVWFDKPLAKLTNKDISLYHGSMDEIKGQLVPHGVNVGATKYSNPRWSIYLWDEKYMAEKWSIAWKLNRFAARICFGTLPQYKNKIIIQNKKNISEKEFIDYIVGLNLETYVYEVKVNINDVEIGAMPTTDEYTLSKPVNIHKKHIIKINKDIINKYCIIVKEEEFQKAYNHSRDFSNVKKNRSSFILNQVLSLYRDMYRKIVYDDLKSGKLNIGDDLSNYKDIINQASKDDLYHLKESYIVNTMKESSISIPQMTYYLQNEYEEEMRHYLNTYRKYYNLMLKEQPSAVTHINEDIRKCLVVIDGLASKGVENNLIQFAKDDLGEIVKAAKKGKPVKVIENTEYVEEGRINDNIDKFLMWLEKPKEKHKGANITLYHASVDIDKVYGKNKSTNTWNVGDVIEPASLSIAPGATLFSNPRNAIYFWDNIEYAYEWGLYRALDIMLDECDYLTRHGKCILVGKNEGMSDDAAVKTMMNFIKTDKLCKKLGLSHFYIYETEVSIHDLEITGIKSIHEYTVSKPVTILKKQKIEITEDLIRKHCMFAEIGKQYNRVRDRELEKVYFNRVRNPILSPILKDDKDYFRGKLASYLDDNFDDPKKELKDNRNKYRHKLNISMFKIDYLGIDTEFESTGLVEDMVNIDDSTNDINSITVQDDNVSISNIVECKLVYNNPNSKQLFSLTDVKSQLIIENSYVVQRDKVGTHCSISPLYNNTSEENVLEFQMILNKDVDIYSIDNKLNEGVIIASLHKFDDEEYKFIKEVCLKLFGVYPKEIKIK